MDDLDSEMYPADRGVTLDNAKKSVGAGWGPLLEMIYSNLTPVTLISCVKEKYGTLRVYYYQGDEVLGAVVTAAEEISALLCEECGQPGHMTYIGGWYLTLCDEHEAIRRNLKGLAPDQAGGSLLDFTGSRFTDR